MLMCAGMRLQSVAGDGGDGGAEQHGGKQSPVASARDSVGPRLHLLLGHLLVRRHLVGVHDLARAVA